MRSHVQNPWTRSPALFVHLSVEEVHQLEAGLDELDRQFGSTMFEFMDRNQLDALKQLKVTLQHALSTGAPHGLKGAER